MVYLLRNHDELTLEMVTDEERDYMYRVYARDHQGRINLGIRRRLAPLLGNNRRRIELMNGLLCSLPGTPVIYYGDEIGMGDNIYLGDRNGVRTPMQWSPDRNAGFSGANPQRLYSPVIIDSEYLFETVNVETQQKNPHSLLWWMRRLIALRQHYLAPAVAVSSCSLRRIPKSWHFREIMGIKAFSWSPTCPDSCSMSNWICRGLPAFGQSKCSVKPDFRRSAKLPICSPYRRTRSIGLPWNVREPR